MNYMLRKGVVHKATNRILCLQQPFSEDDILTMHEVLLTPGVHYIRVSSIAEGRDVITTFLDALNYYHKIGCLTLSSEPLNHNDATDVVQNLVERNLFSNDMDLGNYFATDFDYDCLWIESDKTLFHERWFNRFLDELEHFHTALPVIVFLYDMSI